MAYDLGSIRATKQARPPRILVYGEHGVGKSTFASQAPGAIFIQTEDGLDALDAAAFPVAQSLDDVLGAIGTLYSTEHKYQSVVVDSVDWLENLIWRQVATDNKTTSIEGIGYGKGYVFAADKFREILQGLDALREKKNMAIVLVAHAHIKRFDDPMAESYDRYILKLHDKASALVREWCDIVGFAAQPIAVVAEDVGFNKKAKRAVATGGNILHLQRTPAFDAKSRFALPESVSLNWSAFADALTKSQEPTATTATTATTKKGK